MVATVEERLSSLEARVGEVEEDLIRMRRPQFAVTVEEAKSRLAGPAERSPDAIERFRRIFGRFEGPVDLSARMRDYMYGDRD
jgi:hypothetical protein